MSAVSKNSVSRLGHEAIDEILSTSATVPEALHRLTTLRANQCGRTKTAYINWKFDNDNDPDNAANARAEAGANAKRGLGEARLNEWAKALELDDASAVRLKALAARNGDVRKARKLLSASLALRGIELDGVLHDEGSLRSAIELIEALRRGGYEGESLAYSTIIASELLDASRRSSAKAALRQWGARDALVNVVRCGLEVKDAAAVARATEQLGQLDKLPAEAGLDALRRLYGLRLKAMQQGISHVITSENTAYWAQMRTLWQELDERFKAADALKQGSIEGFGDAYLQGSTILSGGLFDLYGGGRPEEVRAQLTACYEMSNSAPGQEEWTLKILLGLAETYRIAGDLDGQQTVLEKVMVTALQLNPLPAWAQGQALQAAAALMRRKGRAATAAAYEANIPASRRRHGGTE